MKSASGETRHPLVADLVGVLSHAKTVSSDN
jgi:hypothetical protein